MKIYVLTSYSTGLNDPVISFSYDELYQEMERSYYLALKEAKQTAEEQECSALNEYSATAVIYGDWIEWSITELDLPLPEPEFSGNSKRNLIREFPSNPYLLAYFKHNNLKPGDTWVTLDYMDWIDQKHDQFRKLRHLPEHITLNEAEVKDFIKYINENN